MIDFKLFGGFGDGQTDGQTDGRTDIGGCRVAFATENHDWTTLLFLFLNEIFMVEGFGFEWFL